MKITLTIDNHILVKASQLTGIVDQTSLLTAGLKALIHLENNKRLRQQSKTEKPFELVSSRETSTILENHQHPLTPEIDANENPFETFQAIMEISKRCATLPIQDSRSEDDILGYNNIGTFS